MATCQQELFGKTCRPLLDSALACYQNLPDEKLCEALSASGPAPCQAEEQARRVCVSGQALCAARSECEALGSPGMMLWYSFDDAGATVLDQAGCEHVGDVGGATPCQPGAKGSAFQFASGDFVSIADSPAFADLRQLTVEAWVRLDGIGQVNQLISYGDLLGGDSFSIRLESGKLSLLLGLAFSPYPAECDGMSIFPDPGLLVVPAGVWTHVAVSVDDAEHTALYYVGGNLSGSTTIPNGAICTTHEPMLVAGVPDSPSSGFQGGIDELKIWNVKRSAQEICTDGGGVFDADRCAL
jgi:hypothetical protein